MELRSANSTGGTSRVHMPKPDWGGTNNGDTASGPPDERLLDETNSSCSTPYVSAPSSPGGGPVAGFFYSAPASPMHFMLSKASAASEFVSSSSDMSVEFEFSARFNPNVSATAGSMISADELFLNGQIRPMKLLTHLQRPQNLAPLVDLDVEDGNDQEAKDGDQKRERGEETIVRGRDLRLRNRSLHRRTRSLSPMRNWRAADGHREADSLSLKFPCSNPNGTEPPPDAMTTAVSASSARSSSTSSRSSKRWIFLMDFLHRSKSEGRGNSKERFWPSISFSPSQKEKKVHSASRPSSPTRKSKQAPNAAPPKKKLACAGPKPVNAVGKRRVPLSPHELHYTANRAQAEQMRKKTYLPYRQGLLGCLGFGSKSYGAVNGFARALRPVPSR